MSTGLKTDMVTKRPRRLGLGRISVAHFLIALIALIVITPFLEPLQNGRAIELCLFMIVLLSAVLAVGGYGPALAGAIALVIPALATRVISHYRPELLPSALIFATSILFLFFILMQLLRFVLRAPRVDSEVLCAAVARLEQYVRKPQPLAARS